METEMKPQVKKEWKTPELIVLVRSNPEEAVLTTCKGTNTTGGNINKDNGCKKTPCSLLCNALSAS